jgi:hypothetical protein
LAALTAAGGTLSDQATVRLQATVDAHWRGSYDILVRPAAARLDLEKTTGLVEPNFVSFEGSGGISLAQLARIRALADVDIAAPIAVVGYLSYSFSAPIVFTATLPSRPTLYRVTVAATTSDGVNSINVGTATGRVLLGPFDLKKPNAPFATDASYFEYAADGVKVAFPVLPKIQSPLVAVDPAAEAALLGPSGSFLVPLAATLLDPAATVGTFDRNLIPKTFQDSRTALLILKASKDPTIEARPVMPIVVSTSLYAPLTVRLDVTQLGHPFEAFPPPGRVLDRLATAASAAGPGSTVIGSTSVDATGLLRPFGAPAVALTWPGSTAPTDVPFGVGNSQDFRAALTSRPTYEPRAPLVQSPGLPTFGIKPLGPASMLGQANTAREAEQSYRRVTEYPLALGQGFTPQNPYDRPFILAPVGEFRLGDLALPTDPLSYVPLGMYDEPRSQLVADDHGNPLASPRTFTPTFNPAGVLTVPPLAFTSIANGAALKGSSPIDAVRVRVGGLGAFDQASQARVERVAAQISDLGLDVDIVAGSSPRPVNIFVPEYRLGPPAKDLGYVQQGWTTLGAAQSVERGLSALNVILLELALAAAAALAIGLLVIEFAVRRADSAILRALGWSRITVTRWLLAEAAVPSVLIIGVGLAAWMLSHSGPAALVSIVLIGLLIPFGTLLLARTQTKPTVTSIVAGDLRMWFVARALPAKGPVLFALRIVLSYPLRTLGTVLSGAIAGCAGGLAIISLAGAAAKGGPTLLGSAAVGILGPGQATIVIVVVAAGITMVAALLSLDHQDRAADAQILRAIGWSRRSIGRLTILRDGMLAGLATLLAAFLAEGISSSLGTDGLRTATVAAATGLVVYAAGMVVAYVATRAHDNSGQRIIPGASD